MATPYVVILPFCALLTGAGLELILGRMLSRTAKGYLAAISALAALAGVLAAGFTLESSPALEVHLLAWDGPFALAYHVDGLSLLFALLATGIGTAVLLYSAGYLTEAAGATRFYALMLVFVAGLVHLVYSADLFALYLSWEVIGLCSFLLVGFWYQDRPAAVGARKVLVVTHLAGYGLLAAIVLLFVRTGATQWTDPRMAQGLNTGLFFLILTAAAAKSVQFPLHTWIPDAMAAPTPVSALLHSACYVKAGVYLIARLHSLGPWPATWSLSVIWLGTITMAVGALYALVQTDLKRMLAFSTVSQIGYMVMGLGLGTPLGIAAGLLHCLNHGLFKGGLFLGAGAVQHATGTRDMDQLGGLAQHLPRTTLFWLVSAGSLAGLPLMSGFASKWLLYNAALEAGQVLPALVAWLTSIVTVFYMLKASGTVFFGPERPGARLAHEDSAAMKWGMGLLAGGSLVLGLAPQLAMKYLINPLLPALGVSPAVSLTWLGMTTALGSWWSTGGLVLAVLAVAAGGLIYYLLRPANGLAVSAAAGEAAGGVFTGGEPLSGVGALPASDFSAIFSSAWAPFYRLADVDRLYRQLWGRILQVGQILQGISAWLEGRALPAVGVISLLLAILGLMGIPDQVQAIEGHSGRSGVLVWACGLAFTGLILAAFVSRAARKNLPFLALSGLAALAGLWVEQPLLRLGLLEGSALIMFLAIWRSNAPRRSAGLYLAVVLISAALLLGGQGLAGLGYAGPGRALIFTAFILKLALAPLFFWLPQVVAEIPAVTAGLLIGVIDMAAFGELWSLRQASPWLFEPAGPWLLVAGLSTLGGAGLMLAQTDIKRLLAFSTLEDLGYLLAGLALGSEWGLQGALLGAAGHALAKALLFASLAAPEEEAPVRLGRSGLAASYPVSGAAFLVGTLGMLGIPPTLGFVARWRLYAGAAEASPALMFGLLLASALALLAYARVITFTWWGKPAAAARTEPSALVLALIGLALFILAAGLWPALLPGLAAWIGG